MLVGDYVKYKETSKSGKEYWVSGIIIDVKETQLKYVNLLYYIILTEDGDQITKSGDQIEPDIQMERDVKINRIFKKN